MTIAELLNAKEGENVEFKEAKNSFKFDTLVRYACAVFNHGGGRVVFGITNKRSISKTDKAKKGNSHISVGIVFLRKMPEEESKRNRKLPQKPISKSSFSKTKRVSST